MRSRLSKSASFTDNMKPQPKLQLISTNPQQCIKATEQDKDADTAATTKTTKVGSVNPGKLESLPLEIQFMILEEADARDHGCLVQVCKTWHDILQRSKVARAKRYLEHTVRFYPTVQSGPQLDYRLPQKIKIHRTVQIDSDRQYFFKDGYRSDDYRFRIKGPSSGLNVFKDDPILIIPEEDSNGGSKANEKINIDNSKPKNLTDSESGSANGLEITLSQVFFYKYQTSGLFPSLLGSGRQRFLETIKLTQSTTVGSYTETIIRRMKEVAELARTKRCSELMRSTKDKQVITLWERLAATDGEFVFQVLNDNPRRSGHSFIIQEDELEPSEPIRENLICREYEIPPLFQQIFRHPFNHSEGEM